MVLGWGAGVLLGSDPLIIEYLFAFIAGGLVLNVLRGEIPEERQSNFWAFLLGAAAYTALLLFV